MAEDAPTIPNQDALDNTNEEGLVAGADDAPAAIDLDAAAQKFAETLSTAFGTDVIPEPDGEIHRFDDPEKRNGNKSCWYYFDPSGTHGVYGNWGTCEQYRWYLEDFQVISHEDLAAILERVEAAKQERTQRHLENHEAAAKKAVERFNKASPADARHRYLQKKQIPAGNARQEGDKLLIPLRNADGLLRNLQTIDPKGKKLFLKGGEVSGNFSLIGADELPRDGSIIVCEGFATGVTLHEQQGWPVAAAMNAGNLAPVCAALRETLPDSVTIIVAADDDRRTVGNPGLSKAIGAAESIGAELIQPGFPCGDCDCTDFNDVDACKRQQEPGKANELPVKSATNTKAPAKNQPIPLATNLPPVKPLAAAMLPKGFVGFVTDTAKRLQVPNDYIGVACIVVAAGISGAKYRIHPKQNDPWLVTPTMWAGLIGGPSTLKTACMSAAMQPLQEIEKELAAAYTEALEIYQWDCELGADTLKEAKKKAGEIYAKDRDKALQIIREATLTQEPPTRHRYVINDATIEKLGELMGDNPNGLIQSRDELSGWLAKINQEDFQGDRAFFLECFEGLNPFTYDRIGRGTIEIPQCVLSIIGGIQPSKIAPIIRSAVNGTADDGLMQRFQLAVWPDLLSNWKWIDQPRDEPAYFSYQDALRSLHDLPMPVSTGSSINLRFSMSAQDMYIAWMNELHSNLRSDELHPVMQSHLAKMPKTIAGLALLFELIDGGRTEVGDAATTRALLWAPYLISHAERLYSLSTDQDIAGAKLILSRREKLDAIFTARDVQRKNWTGLSSAQAVTDALNTLVDHRYLSELPVSTSKVGGRPSIRYRWHTAAGKKS